MSSANPFSSKEKKGKTVRQYAKELPPNDPQPDSVNGPTKPYLRTISNRSRYPGSSAAHGGKGPTWSTWSKCRKAYEFGDGSVTLPQKFKESCKIGDPDKQTRTLPPKFKESCFVTTITEVDPENIPDFYPLTTTRLASEEDIPSTYYTTTSMVDSKRRVQEPRGYFENCSKCGTGHHPRASCPPLPCKTCFDPHHTSADCPFFDHIPKGAVFDRVNYEIICGCGNIFNEDKWDCTMCTGSPKLESKYCHICDSNHVHHSSHECPNDKESAAEFKAIRDQAFSREKIPYTSDWPFLY